jgi:hypothetical protein
MEEAAALRAAAHPGVVELVDAADGVVRTQLVKGRSLGDTRPLTAEEVAGVTAAVAATLADLHDLGITHGGIDAGHVIVADEGRPVLCSLGRGGEPADDVAALGHLITEMLSRRLPERPAPRSWAHRRQRLGPMLAPPAAPALAALVAEATAPHPADRPSARALAAAVTQHIPSARLPRSEAPPAARPPSSRKGRTRWPALPPIAVLTASASAFVIFVIGMLLVSLRDSPGVEPAPPLAAGDADADAGAAAPSVGADFNAGILTVDGARYRVGQAGDTVAIGDWACSGRPTPVILRPSSGELFAFDDWAQPGHDVTARLLGRVDHATEVRATPIVGGGCHELEVLRSEGPAARVDVTP